MYYIRKSQVILAIFEQKKNSFYFYYSFISLMIVRFLYFYFFLSIFAPFHSETIGFPVT